jgi:phosphoglycolate phosphatase-like HAD superfamily hydrolase
VERSKPDPDVVCAALAKGKLRPETAIMLGDTPYDIEAAGRAGVPTIAFRCGGWWDDRALAGALAIYDDPAALLADFDRSPLAGGAQGPARWRGAVSQ